MHTGCVFLSFLGMYAGALSHSLSFRPHVSLGAKRLETRDSPAIRGPLSLSSRSESRVWTGRKKGRTGRRVGGWVGGWVGGRTAAVLPPTTNLAEPCVRS
jgi:hypothetical protein